MMTPLETNLINYALYHRDKRNIITHFFGIPLILFSIFLLLSKQTIALQINYLPITPALLAAALMGIFYCYLNLKLGIIMIITMIGMLMLSNYLIPLLTLTEYLLLGIGLFIFGWVLQFIGHYYEKKKPAFFDDIKGLIIGPLFVMTELGFKLGLLQGLKNTIEEHAGPETIVA